MLVGQQLNSAFYFIFINLNLKLVLGFPGGTSGKAGDIREAGLIPGSGRSPAGGHDNPLQNSYLENPPGQRSLTGYSPWGHKELYTTKATEHARTPNRIK